MAKHEKFTVAQARKYAAAFHEEYGAQITAVARVFNIPADWFAGLMGMETIKNAAGKPYVWPDTRSTRLEAHVLSALKRVRDSLNPWAKYGTGEYAVTKGQLKGMSDAALHNLASSWGQTQIMGYHLLGVFGGMRVKELFPLEVQTGAGITDGNAPLTLAMLRDPSLHLWFTAQMMHRDPLLHKWVKRAQEVIRLHGATDNAGKVRMGVAGAFSQVCHVWNSGREWDGQPGNMKTHSPYYMHNCALVAQAYRELLAHIGPVAVAERVETREKRWAVNSDPQRDSTLVEGPGGHVAAVSSPKSRPIAEMLEDANTLWPESERPIDRRDPLPPTLTEAEAEDAILDAHARGLISDEERAAALIQLEDSSDVVTFEQGQIPPENVIVDPKLHEARIRAYNGEETERMSQTEQELGLVEGASIEQQSPPLPSEPLKPGWQTSEGHMTALFVLVAMVLGLFGVKNWDAARIQNTYEAVMVLAQTLGPIVVAAVTLIKYQTSRGKIKSNALNASAAHFAANGATTPMLLAGSGRGLNDILGGIFGGGGLKDPRTIGGIVGTVGQIIGGKTGRVITGIIGGAKGDDTVSDERLAAALQIIVNRLGDLEDHRAFNIQVATVLLELARRAGFTYDPDDKLDTIIRQAHEFLTKKR